MPGQQRNPYVLGIDLGSASLGWAVVAVGGDGSPAQLLRTGVRVFDPGPPITPSAGSLPKNATDSCTSSKFEAT